MTDQQSFGYGQESPTDSSGDHNAIAFVCRQLIAKISTSKLVQVTAVTGGGAANPAGTVDVLPLVQQIDGNGYGLPHGTVSGLPWARVQGGKNAVICDPLVGDVGYVVAMDRDTSVVRKQSPGFTTTKGFLPGSRRKFSIADGVYVGGCLNVAPDQYLVFTTDGVRLVNKDGSSLAFTSTGFALADQNGNSLVSVASGMTLSFQGANKIIMASGFVNIIAPALQVNGVPVTVP